MTYSLGASGTVDEVKNTLTIQAEQYASELVDHVKDLVHKVLDNLEAPHGVTVSTSGHIGTDGAQFGVSVAPLPPSTPDSPPPSDPAPVS